MLWLPVSCENKYHQTFAQKMVGDRNCNIFLPGLTQLHFLAQPYCFSTNSANFVQSSQHLQFTLLHISISLQGLSEQNKIHFSPSIAMILLSIDSSFPACSPDVPQSPIHPLSRRRRTPLIFPPILVVITGTERLLEVQPFLTSHLLCGFRVAGH